MTLCLAAAGMLDVPLAHPASAAEKIGVAEEVNNTVTAKGKGKSRRLKANAPVYRKETVSAGANSSGTPVFLDRTRLSLGPGASIRLDDFVVGPKGRSAKRYAVNALHGAFRFVTGVSQKSAYKIRSPPRPSASGAWCSTSM